MKKTILKTADGSTTLHIPEWNEQYHSKHGAIAEAYHVFIKEGLYHKILNRPEKLIILEMGFGTGLNAFLTRLESEKFPTEIHYTSIEAHPLELEEVSQLNFASQVEVDAGLYLDLHKSKWEEEVQISNNFFLTKKRRFFSEVDENPVFDLIYFDAFGIRVQPELWTEEIFLIMYNALVPDGVLVTYAASGRARRALQSVGFQVSRIPGPPGKREMMRAVKI